jgi:hypothetical protein
MCGHPVVARARPGVRPRPGAKLELRFDLGRAHLFGAASGKALRLRNINAPASKP